MIMVHCNAEISEELQNRVRGIQPVLIAPLSSSSQAGKYNWYFLLCGDYLSILEFEDSSSPFLSPSPLKEKSSETVKKLKSKQAPKTPKAPKALKKSKKSKKSKKAPKDGTFLKYLQYFEVFMCFSWCGKSKESSRRTKQKSLRSKVRRRGGERQQRYVWTS